MSSGLLLCFPPVFHLSPAYHQLVLHEDSHDLTAFITKKRLFHYCRVPYSLASASSALQKVIETVLKVLPSVHNYLDDVTVAGSSVQDTMNACVMFSTCKNVHLDSPASDS